MMFHMFHNRKGIDYYTITVAFIGILLLSFVIFSLFTKYYRLSSGIAVGAEQFRILKTYANGEKALLFVDDSARLSLEQAAYAYGKSGFYASGSACGSKGGINYWTKDIILPQDQCIPKLVKPEGCYPDESLMKSSLASLFAQPFGKFVANFNSKSDVKIPFNYQPFKISSTAGRTEVLGISNEPIILTSQRISYEVKPSFRESIQRDLISDGNSLVATARQTAKKKEKDARALVSSVDRVNGLDWNEKFAYNKVSSSCSHPIGTCPCCETRETCEEYAFDENGDPIVDENGKVVCNKKGFKEVRVADGTEYEVVPYDSIDILMSVNINDQDSASGHRQFFIYDEASNKVILQELEYSFGLNWIEAYPDRATRICSCSTGSPC